MAITKSRLIKNIYTEEIVVTLSKFSILSFVDGNWDIRFRPISDLSIDKGWRYIKLICKLEKKT